MYIKIYFNDKPLFLCDRMTDEKEISEYAHHDDAILIDEFSHAAVNTMIHDIHNNILLNNSYVHNMMLIYFY